MLDFTAHTFSPQHGLQCHMQMHTKCAYSTQMTGGVINTPPPPLNTEDLI